MRVRKRGLLGHLVTLGVTAPIVALAVVAAPVNAAQAPVWQPQLVTASPARDVATAQSVTAMPTGLAPGVGLERGLQIQTIRLKRAVSARFPEIKDIGGWRPDSMKWHPNGLAIDVIIPDWGSPAGRALGDRIARFALDNADKFKVEAVIWQRTYRPAHGSPQLMSDLGNADANHYTHVHIATYGGGYPKGGDTYFG